MFYRLFTLLLICSFTPIITIHCQTLSNIESVEYDPINDQFLISNGSNVIAQNYPEEDLSLFGEASASHGMEVIDSTLFTIDGSFIRGFSLVDGSAEMELNITGSQFLNGLTSDSTGILYATDFAKREIIRIDATDFANPTFERIVSNTQVTPNGIHLDSENNRLIFVSWGENAAVRAVDLDDNSLSIIASTTYGNMDGIASDKNGNYYISTWNPARIIKYDSDFSEAPIEITTPGPLSSPADITIAKARGILAIPHYPGSGDEVIYVDINEGGVSANQIGKPASISFAANPNPVINTTEINFHLESSSTVSISLIGADGKLIQEIFQGHLSAGTHSVNFNKGQLSTGVYYLSLSYNEGTAILPILLKDNL